MNKTLIALAVAATSFTAHAEITQCTPISSVPYTIAAPGIYCVTGDLMTNSANTPAITINANNVVLDLNGHRLGGGGAGAGTQASGIFAADRKNITIRNGTIRAFYMGIEFADSLGNSGSTNSSGHLIEDLRLDGNTALGLNIAASRSVIRNNLVASTGGSTVAWGATGIRVNGEGNLVSGNEVANTYANNNGEASGIDVGCNSLGSSIIQDNRIADTLSPASWATGIRVASCGTAAIRGNTVINTTSPRPASARVGIIVFTDGVTADISGNTVINSVAAPGTSGIELWGASVGVAAHNRVQNFTTPYSGAHLTQMSGTNY
jgi:hypothetical protein